MLGFVFPEVDHSSHVSVARGCFFLQKACLDFLDKETVEELLSLPNRRLLITLRLRVFNAPNEILELVLNPRIV